MQKQFANIELDDVATHGEAYEVAKVLIAMFDRLTPSDPTHEAHYTNNLVFYVVAHMFEHRGLSVGDLVMDLADAYAEGRPDLVAAMRDGLKDIDKAIDNRILNEQYTATA
jgi:hypothetical protein